MPSNCIVEPVHVRDMSQIVRLFVEPKVRAYLGGPLSANAAERRARELLETGSPAKVWSVRHSLNEPSSLLGVVVLDRHHDIEAMEVSYLFLPEHWGQGHASSAVGQVLAYAFNTLHLPRVLAETQSANIASIRLLERLGLRLLRKVVRFGAEQSIYAAESASDATQQLAQAGRRANAPPRSFEASQGG